MGKPSFHMQEPDPALLWQVQQRTPDGRLTPEAWQALLALREAYGNKLLNHAYYRTGDQVSAEDIIERTFFERVRDGLKGKRADSPFIGWLVTIVNNEIRKYWRDKKRVRSWAHKPGQGGSMQPPEELSIISAPTMGRLPQAKDVDEWDLIQRAMQKLPRKERAAFYLHHVLGFTVNEVAEIMKITGKAAAQLTWRATVKFRIIYNAMKNENA